LCASFSGRNALERAASLARLADAALVAAHAATLPLPVRFR
jgi:hypothetical protein